jgi:hypothetical protein
MARRLALGEYLQVRDLIYQGEAFGVPAGTPAVFLESTLTSSRVRLTGGLHTGATAWVASEAFHPTDGRAAVPGTGRSVGKSAQSGQPFQHAESRESRAKTDER